MEGLFSAPAPFDLGPSAVLPEGWAPRRTQVVGVRVSQLRTQVKLLAPREPGVYVMVNAADEIIYVGKAKNLRIRLFTYFRAKGRDRRSRRIIGRARAILWEVLPGEFTALLRELELIRRWRPTWNVQGQPLRRRHAFVCLAGRPAPHVVLTRRPPRSTVATFGPLPMSHTARDAVRWLNDAFALRDCPPGAIEFFPSPNPLFPIAPPAGCLRLELGTCLGPCTADVSRSAYHDKVRRARAFLDGRDRSLLEDLKAQMEAAAVHFRFETAAVLRDKLAALSWLAQRLDLVHKAQSDLTFVYPLGGGEGRDLWYLVHGARVLGCVAAPFDAATAATALAALRRVFGRGNSEPLLEAYEPIDGKVLVLSWFRKHPRERRRAIAPADALRRARGLA